ncbi:hypothetical protein BTJ45_01153 [Bacillus mycoides]|nr:hypothetical protein BTJ45_01153 [Bacillus mycoides]
MDGESIVRTILYELEHTLQVQAEDDAYFYRKHGGFRHKVDVVCDIL